MSRYDDVSVRNPSSDTEERQLLSINLAVMAISGTNGVLDATGMRREIVSGTPQSLRRAKKEIRRQDLIGPVLRVSTEAIATTNVTLLLTATTDWLLPHLHFG